MANFNNVIWSKISYRRNIKDMFFVKMLSVPCEDCAMRLNLREIIHVPGAAVPFDFGEIICCCW